MTTRKVELTGMACICVLLGMAGCASPRHVHAVFFTCRPDAPESAIETLIRDGNEMLSQVPTVRRVESGRRDVEENREVSDTDYDVGLVVYFDDRQGLLDYIEHPIHKQYVANNKKTWTKVVVYDFITP